MDTNTLLQAIKTSIKATEGLRDKSATNTIQKVTNAIINGLGNMIDTGVQSKYGDQVLWASPGSSARAKMDMDNRASTTSGTTSKTTQNKTQPTSTTTPTTTDTQPTSATTSTATNTQPTTTQSADEIIEYTYKPGDTFGQVLLDLGLSDGSDLWGNDGAVAYYTKQLNDQGIYGNIPIGTTIRLRKRK